MLINWKMAINVQWLIVLKVRKTSIRCIHLVCDIIQFVKVCVHVEYVTKLVKMCRVNKTI
jgi:hypothetical protein